MRTLPDGSLLFSKSEGKPKNINGYYIDPSDPYHFIPEDVKCIYRKERHVRQPCGKLKILYHCEYHCKQVTMADCILCDDAKEE